MTGRFGSLNAEHQMPCKSLLAFTKVSRIERRNIVRTATQNHFCHLGKPDFLAMANDGQMQCTNHDLAFAEVSRIERRNNCHYFTLQNQNSNPV